MIESLQDNYKIGPIARKDDVSKYNVVKHFFKRRFSFFLNHQLYRDNNILKI